MQMSDYFTHSILIIYTFINHISSKKYDAITDKSYRTDTYNRIVTTC